MALRLFVLLWEVPGNEDALAEFEDSVLTLVPAHQGNVLLRAKVVDRKDGEPREVQLLDFPDHAALNSYLADPQRAALIQQFDRDTIVARSQVLRIESVD